MKTIVAGAGAALTLLAGAAQAQQQVDMQAVMLWSTTKIAHFEIVGVHDERTPIAAEKGNYAQGHVKDSLMLAFDWNIQENKLVGEVAIVNETSITSELGSVDIGCKPPKPAGDYEHFTASAVRQRDEQSIEVDGVRNYPPAEVAECEADTSYKPVAAKVEEITEFVAVPNPMMLVFSGADNGNGNIVVSPDSKSFIVKTTGWTWTYTPTPVE